MADEAKLVIFEAVTPVVVEPDFGPGGRPIEARVVSEVAMRVGEVSVNTLRKSTEFFFDSIGQMLEQMLQSAPKTASAYRVDKVELHCQISADGKIGIAGIGMGLKGDAGIKFVLQRVADA